MAGHNQIMIIEFSSITDLLNQTVKVISEADPGELIEATPKKSATGSLTDLFGLGRVIALANLLSNDNLQFHLRLVDGQKTTFDRLRELGIGTNEELSIHLSHSPRQQSLLDEEEPPPPQPADSLLDHRTYWRVLLPITTYQFKSGLSDDDVAASVNDIVADCSSRVAESLNHFKIPPTTVGPDLSRLFHSIFGELAANAVAHSGEATLIATMTMSKRGGWPSRYLPPSMRQTPSSDSFELLVMDLGCGMMPAVRRNISVLSANSDTDIEPAGYRDFIPWDENFEGTQKLESSLLENIFRGELLVRQGRRSEGLWEIADTLAWFEGMMSLRTGRTEVVISGTDPATGSVQERAGQKKADKNFLPGVVASTILPSQLLRHAAYRVRFAAGEFIPTTIKILSQLPEGFLSLRAEPPMRRRSERASETIRRAALEDPSSLIALDFDLAQSIDVDFLDSVLQELARSENTVEPILPRLILLNVPRQCLPRLRKGNGASFLRLKGSWIVALDELDIPNILGAPRISDNVHDIEDCIISALLQGRIKMSTLTKQFGLKSLSENYLKRLLPTSDHVSIICFDPLRNEVVSADLHGEITKLRQQTIDDISEFVVCEGESLCYKLRNGIKVDRIIDFDRLWASGVILKHTAKLLASEISWGEIETLAGFIDNGATLAAELQRLSGTPELIILDPLRQDRWSIAQMRGRCALVLDILYPGDDASGYVSQFLADCSNTDKPSITALISAVDARTSGSHQINQIPVISSSMGIMTILPKPISDDDTFRRTLNRGDYYRYTNYAEKSQSKKKKKLPLLKPRPLSLYSPIELSSDFWQNVSALGVVSPNKTGREERAVLFYENNERLIRHARLRKYVQTFVADFISRVLQYKVDVILHPSHAVGATLAQWVSAELPHSPLIIVVPQRRYGGSIQPSEDDYDRWWAAISEHEKKSGTRMRALILDDSVLSGSSLFTMAGIANKLRLSVGGIAVLLNRLTPEVSAAIDSLDAPFSYLYRLHMPVLGPESEPDYLLSKLNDRVLQTSASTYAHLCCEKIRERCFGFGTLISENWQTRNFEKFYRRDEIVHELELGDATAEQVTRNLLLHPDGGILSFNARVAIAYNFLGVLIKEPGFWRLLRLFLGVDKGNLTPGLDDERTRILALAIMYVIAFSRWLEEPSRYSEFENLCIAALKVHSKAGTWEEKHKLIVNIVLMLGVIGSDKIFREFGAIIPIFTRAVVGNGTQRSDISRIILGALSWNVSSILLKMNGKAWLPHKEFEKLKDSVNARKEIDKHRPARLLAFFDVMSPAQKMEESDINRWIDTEEFCEMLFDNTGDSLHYLRYAPGYTCTLLSIIRMCKADTVVLFSRNQSDEHYFLRSWEVYSRTTNERRPSASLFRSDALSDRLQNMMDARLVGTSQEVRDLDLLDALNQQSYKNPQLRHKWAFVAPVLLSAKDSPIKYRILMGFSRREPDASFLANVFRFWQRSEQLLRDVLPKIHSKYIESSTTWNALIQSMATVHPVTKARPNEPETLYHRRVAVDDVVRRVAELGDLLAHAVEIYSLPVYDEYRLDRDLNARYGKIIEELISRDLNELWPDSHLNKLIESFESVVDSVGVTRHFTMHVAVMRFVFYECLKNALSYHRKGIKVRLTVEDRSTTAPTERIGKCLIKLRVTNDVDLKFKTFWEKAARGPKHTPEKLGLAACYAAAESVGGDFSAHAKGSKWISELILPGFWVPTSLEGLLYER